MFTWVGTKCVLVMKLFVAVSLLLGVAVARPADEHYDSKYDDFNVQDIIGNTRLLKGYVNCFLEKGSCTPDGKTFKQLLPEVINTSCEKCTSKQAELIREVIRAFQEKLPEEYEQLIVKFDPEAKRKKELDQFLAGTK